MAKNEEISKNRKDVDQLVNLILQKSTIKIINKMFATTQEIKRRKIMATF